MQKRDFETYQKRFRDFEILLKFSETHVFRGTIRHPLYGYSNNSEFRRITLWEKEDIRLVDSRLIFLFFRLVKYLLNFPNGRQCYGNCDTVKHEN